MEKLTTVQKEGIYIARKDGKSYLVKIAGSAPFLKLVNVFDFELFVKNGKIDTATIIEDEIQSYEWYSFDYIVSAEPTVVQKKADLKSPYTEKQMDKWTKVFNKEGEEKCIISIMQEIDYPLEFVQSEIITRIKRLRDEKDMQ